MGTELGSLRRVCRWACEGGKAFRNLVDGSGSRFWDVLIGFGLEKVDLFCT